MNEQLSTNPRGKSIASVTLLLVENQDGVRFCDTVSSMDETLMTAYDVVKFQFHCLHWTAALHEILVRKLVHQGEVAKSELQNQADELKSLKERLKALEEQIASLRWK